MNRSRQRVSFRETDDARYPYAAVVDGTTWTVRVNEFPEAESLYSLIINGEVVEELMEWPAAWVKLVRGPETPGGPANEDDPHERAEFERELAHAERTAKIRPSKLVK